MRVFISNQEGHIVNYAVQDHESPGNWFAQPFRTPYLGANNHQNGNPKHDSEKCEQLQ